jgi:diguanylate cyclase (GGDEF)-like protein
MTTPLGASAQRLSVTRERVPLVPMERSDPSPNGGGSSQDDALERSLLEQTLSDNDQTLSDVDQTRSDSDQDRSDRDQDSSDRDQRASDLEQAAADREQASHAGGYAEHEIARADRVDSTDERRATTAERARTAADRLSAADARDLSAQDRDLAAAERDRAAEALGSAPAASSRKQRAGRRLAELRARAADDRARAAADRRAAAADRATAAQDRKQAAIDLRHAYHDDLTGALRREMGEVALQHEVDRARRGDGRMVLAFVDVDKLKSLNDRDGHSAGDALLVGVVATMRAKLRSFDPVVRYGGDEFVCAMLGTDAVDVGERFVEVKEALASEYDKAGISVGVAELQAGDTLADLIARGDTALYEAKRRV